MSRSGQLAVAGMLALLAGSACASAGDVLGGMTGNTMYGEVRGVDRSRLQLRDDNTGRMFSVQVPEGTPVRTTSLSGAPLTFEQLIPGLVVRGLAVK